MNVSHEYISLSVDTAFFIDFAITINVIVFKIVLNVNIVHIYIFDL